MFERHHEPIISRIRFLRRVLTSIVLALGIVGASLAIGMVGYRVLGGLSWVDSFMNAAMILSGMGPVDVLRSSGP